MASARHPTRRDGAIALALFLLPWVASLALVRSHHHLDGGTVGTLVAVSLGLPTLWVTWAAYRGPRRSGGLRIAEVADQLAVAVGAQWGAEAVIRRLNDPYPLPVSWTAADASLTDAWDSLVKLATSGAGWPSPPPRETWAADPDNLAGRGGELAEVLARVPTGRLVVLGEPGAGKTMLMIRLVLDLLARRVGGDPVPYLASIASWNPVGQSLQDWLAAQLVVDHPALANPPQSDRTESTQAAALLASGLILPVLDGLDEIPEQIRGPAISRINDALRPGAHLVVTCRTRQYRAALSPPDGIEVTMRAAAAIQLRPLDAGAVGGYLCDDAAGPVARARWNPVLKVLGTETPAGQALRTPLMVSLARAVYNPRPGELTETLRDPAELCDQSDQTAVESLLFDAFIPAAFRNDPAGRWKVHDARRWLVFLARHLERSIGSPDLAWWQLRRAVPGTAFGFTFGLVAGLVCGLVAAAGAGISFGLQYGLGDGLMYGFLAGLLYGLVAGLVLGFPAVFVSGLAGPPGDLAKATSPLAVLVRDRQAALLNMLAGGLAAGLAVGLALGLAVTPAGGLFFGLWAGFVGACGLSLSRTAWPSYTLTRGWLAARGQLPWSLMRFLADAHRRGVLRQAGAVYQFRHIELQHRLANQDTDKEANSSVACS